MIANAPPTNTQSAASGTSQRTADWLNAAIIVAHPDDETLWAGGLILSHPRCRWFIASLCRGSDLDRSPKFFRVLQNYRARGIMADLDDGPEQTPLSIPTIQDTVLEMLPERSFDLILTHAPDGEYTRHHRHEEVSRAVTGLWQEGVIHSSWLGLFAYEDDSGRRLPQAVPSADQVENLPAAIVQEKDRLIREVYGFGPDSWEARTAPRTEAFWLFNSPESFQARMERKEVD